MKTLYIIPMAERIEESMALAKEYNAAFEYNDFYVPDLLEDKEACRRRIEFYKSLQRDRKKDMLHGAFLDIAVHSDDPKIREISGIRIRQSLEIARELGIRGVVFHTNMIANFRLKSYQKNWIERNVRFFQQMLEEYGELEIFMENMFDETPDMLAALAERMQEQERFHVCFDYGHALIFGRDIKAWVKALAPYIGHMHINDNDLQEDLHETVGAGSINWKEFTDLINEYGIQSSLLIEMKEPEKQRASIRYMKEQGIYPL